MTTTWNNGYSADACCHDIPLGNGCTSCEESDAFDYHARRRAAAISDDDLKRHRVVRCHLRPEGVLCVHVEGQVELLELDLTLDPQARRVTTVKQAALRFRGVVWTLPRPARHCHILHALHAVLGWNGETRRIERLPDEEQLEQGFVTSDDEFVTRRQAAAIAQATGQLPALHWPPDLYSEDLW